MQRSDNYTLPNDNELSKILLTEDNREVPSENLDIHFPDFYSAKKLLHVLNVESNFFDDNHNDIHNAVNAGVLLLDKLVTTALAGQASALKPYFDEVYDYLSEEDVPNKSDLIFIFGSKTPLRPLRAAELYHEHLADRVMVSGKHAIYAKEKQTEASLYAHILRANGIANEYIIKEENSITVPDNVRSSLNLLDRKNIAVKSIILVNSPYSQRRGWTVFKKYLPSHIQIYRVNSDCATEYKKENWYKNEHTMRVVLNEFIKMKASVVYNSA